MEHANQPKRNQIGKTIFVYLGSAWIFIEAFNFLIDRYNFNTVFLDVIILLVIFGLPATIIHTWFRHQFTSKSIIFHAINIILAASTIGYNFVNPDSLNPTEIRLLNFKSNQKKVAESINSIAILPFSNYSGNSDNDYLSAGIHDALISAMGQVGAIRVISRTSTLAYVNSDKTLQDIASELNVDAIIEGSLLSAEDSVQVQIKLINVFPEELQLWSQTYDVSLENLLNVYGKMTQNIAKEVNITISPEEEKLLKKSRSVNPDAYEAYLKGKYSMGLLSQEGIQGAMGYFNQAIEIDPEFAPAYGGLGGIWAFLKQMDFVSADEANPHIINNLSKAFLLDSTLAEVYYWDAIKKVWTDYDWQGGERAFLKSIELNPNFSESRALFAHYLMCLSRWDESKKQMSLAIDNDPNNPFIKVLQLMQLMNLKEYDSVIVKGTSLQKFMPTNPLVNLALINSYHKTSQYDLALDQIILKVQIEADTAMSDFIKESYQKSGFEKTLNELASLLENMDDKYVSAQTFQFLYDMGGNRDKVLEWIEKGYIRKDPDMPYIAIATYSDRYRNEPRFQEIITRMNLNKNSLQ